MTKFTDIGNRSRKKANDKTASHHFIAVTAVEDY